MKNYTSKEMLADVATVFKMLSKRKRSYAEGMSALTYMPAVAMRDEDGITMSEACKKLAVFYSLMAGSELDPPITKRKATRPKSKKRSR